MTQLALQITPLAPLIARDGRPFGGAGTNRMRCLPWILPSTMVGSLRTMIGNALGGDFNESMVQRLLRVQHCGPFPVIEDQWFLPAAQDARKDNNGSPVRLDVHSDPAPLSDLPNGLGLMLPPVDAEFNKQDSTPAWWSLQRLATWLATPKGCPADFLEDEKAFRSSVKIEERTHVQIDPASYAAKDKQLFTTEALAIESLDDSRNVSLVSVVETADEQFSQQLSSVGTFQTVGGERRLTCVTSAAMPPTFDESLKPLRQALSDLRVGDRLRMYLATPGVFADGWVPSWLVTESDGYVGEPPGLEGRLKVRLRGVANQRWEPVSGWCYQSNGPKPVRRMVPAGAVYVFRIEHVQDITASDLWLRPVSDDEQLRRDGFGASIWGVAEPE